MLKQFIRPEEYKQEQDMICARALYKNAIIISITKAPIPLPYIPEFLMLS